MIKTVQVGDEVRTVGRPDMQFGMDWQRTKAKRHPKYVYSTKRGKLLHEVGAMEFDWWELGPSGAYWVRCKSPRVFYITKCGYSFFGPSPEAIYPRDTASRATLCELPKPDAVLCGRCRGEGPVFGKCMKQKPGGPTYKEARQRIGCAVEVHGDAAPVGVG